MKLIVAGSLDFTDDAYLRHVIDKIRIEHEIVEIVCGSETRGVHWTAKHVAADLGIAVKEFSIDVGRYGRRAGFVRNEKMVDYGTELIVVWDGKASLAKHIINVALDKGLSINIHNITSIVGGVNDTSSQSLRKIQVSYVIEDCSVLAFLNSYNKAKRFVIAGGSQVRVCQNGHILGISELGGYKRTHTGSADIDAQEYIKIICSNAETEFKKLIEQKEKMKTIDISKKDIQHLISELYFEENLIKDTQMSILKKELDNPTFKYGTSENNLWTAYNHITYSLKGTHPKDYIETHQKVNKYFSEQFNLFNNRDIQSIVETQYEIEPVFSLGESILV